MSPTLAIEAHGLRKLYGGRLAVDSLDLEVESGTVLGFLGPNGAGKTSVIRMLSTVLPLNGGSFTVAGAPHTRPSQIRRRVGVLPESAGYPLAQTGKEWLTYHAQLFGASRRAARATADRLLEQVGLADRSRSRIAVMSRGMRQRLGIARALVNDPSVVFLDEPTLGLDPLGQRRVLELVTRIAREHGVTVVLSTHVLAEVEQVCDRVLIINRGREVAQGTVSEIVRRAAAPRRGVLTVPPEATKRAVELLSTHGLAAAAAVNGSRGDIELEMPGHASREEASAAALGCLLQADVPVLGFTVEGGRLSDAFLAMTEAGQDG